MENKRKSICRLTTGNLVCLFLFFIVSLSQNKRPGNAVVVGENERTGDSSLAMSCDQVVLFQSFYRHIPVWNYKHMQAIFSVTVRLPRTIPFLLFLLFAYYYFLFY